MKGKALRQDETPPGHRRKNTPRRPWNYGLTLDDVKKTLRRVFRSSKRAGRWLTSRLPRRNSPIVIKDQGAQDRSMGAGSQRSCSCRCRKSPAKDQRADRGCQPSFQWARRGLRISSFPDRERCADRPPVGCATASTGGAQRQRVARQRQRFHRCAERWTCGEKVSSDETVPRFHLVGTTGARQNGCSMISMDPVR